MGAQAQKAHESAAAQTVLDEGRSDLREGETVIDRVDTKGIYEGAAVR